jgi:hypothetical protein
MSQCTFSVEVAAAGAGLRALPRVKPANGAARSHRAQEVRPQAEILSPYLNPYRSCLMRLIRLLDALAVRG